MSSDPGTPTLDQLQVFITVVEVGSFAGAARKLGRATSVISYAIANLENQLGVQLFDREQTRKPILTEAGRTVLGEARSVANGIAGLRARVKGLLQGLEAELHVVLDVMLPAWRAVDALKAFRAEFPTVSLYMSIEALGAVPQAVLNRTATVGVGGPLNNGIAGIERIGIGSVELIPVAAPDHPLILTGRNPPGATRDHVQLVLTDRSPLTQGRDINVLATQTWRLADLGAKRILLREGVGWGNMPEPMVREDIAAGRLAVIDSPDLPGGQYLLEVFYRTDTPPGPAATWLIERFERQVDDSEIGTSRHVLAGGRRGTARLPAPG